MYLKANLWRITENPDSREFYKYPFKIQDVMGLMQMAGLSNSVIVDIDPYDFDNDPEKIKEQINLLAKSDMGNGIVIMAAAYVSTKEFPEDKFYCSAIDKVEEKDKIGKRDIPFDDIISRQCKVLTDAGFVNINNCCAHEFTDIFVSPINRNGAKVFNKANELCGK